jgi:hypothetical protein
MVVVHGDHHLTKQAAMNMLKVKLEKILQLLLCANNVYVKWRRHWAEQNGIQSL